MSIRDIEPMEWGFIAGIAAIVAAAGCAIYRDSVAEKYEIRKDQWNCTASHTETVLVPQQVDKTTILIPQVQVICDVYQRHN